MVKRLLYSATIVSITVVFILGVLLGWELSTSKLSDATKIVKEGELDTESFLIEQDLFSSLGEKSCVLTKSRLDELGKQLAQLGRTLGTPTSEQDLGAENYNLLKRRFHLLQIKTYTLEYDLKKRCDIHRPIVLFYYSRNNSASAEQGIILDTFVKEYDAHVFAIEYGYSKELRFLEQYYNVTTVPTIILNFNQTVNGMTNFNKLEATTRS